MSVLDSAPSADRNLLFGILALQMDFVSRDALIKAMHAWVLEKSKPLGQLLIEQGAMAAEHRALLEPLVQKHIEMHGGDAQKSLASVSSLGSARQQLEQIDDAEVHQSLAHVASKRAAEDDPWATRPPTVGEPTSAGQRFRILRPHAEGGLGKVFVARDEELRRDVALKEIKDRLADEPDKRSRFLLEAEITGGLEHPGIVPVYGLGKYADGRPFYAMRFIRGDSLQDAIARFHRAETPNRDAGERTLALRKLLGRFLDVCNAIAYAHARGVLHRDLKPGNIMLGKYGETLVVDWGLAKPLGRAEAASESMEGPLQPSSASGSNPTQMGSAIGTPAYMPPEQAAGQLDKLGPASDVYSLGATLYCLLTGVAPFEGKDIGAVLRQVQNGEFRPPRQVKPTVPAALEAVCLKAMALKPEVRYASPHGLAEDIEHWLADEPVSAWREPWQVRARRWVGQHRTLVTTAAATLLVATVCLTLATVLLQAANDAKETALRQAEDNAAEARHQEQLALEQKQEAAANALEAKHQKERAEEERDRTNVVLGTNSVLLANREWEVGHARSAQEWLDKVPSPLRYWEWHYLRRKFQGSYCTLYGHTSTVSCVAFSPDGRRLASASDDGTAKLWDAVTGRVLHTLRGRNSSSRISAYCVAFSPDGKRLTVAFYPSENEVGVWDTDTGLQIFTLKKEHTSILDSSFFTRVAFSPDGKRLAGASGRKVTVWGISTRRVVLTLEHNLDLDCVAFSPDGKYLAGGDNDGMVHIWDAHSGHPLNKPLKGHNKSVRSLVFSPDGRRLASSSDDKTVRLWDAHSGRPLTGPLTGHTGIVFSVAFSPDCRRLASGSGIFLGSGEVMVWDVATGQQLLNLKGHTGAVCSVSFSPDGKRLASGSIDNTIKIWDLSTTDQEALTFKGHDHPLANIAFSSDGKLLASGSGMKLESSEGTEGEIKVWVLRAFEWVNSELR